MHPDDFAHFRILSFKAICVTPIKWKKGDPPPSRSRCYNDITHEDSQGMTLEEVRNYMSSCRRCETRAQEKEGV